ncbi:hypothetical protein [Variovorax sp. LT1R16]|uniref:hypothetical protein n=1 Tax=Variovorax sp. LT1R16 TaxID=3443728 RepID=UPI003F455BC9
MKNPPPSRILGGVALSLAVLVGCSAGPKLEAQWTNPAFNAQSRMLQDQRVLIACDAYDAAVRQICQDQLARGVLARGATPVTVPPGTPLAQDRELDAQLVPTAQSMGARAVLTVTLNPATASAGSGLSVGIGGFSFGRGGGAGVGLSAPIGGGQVATGFAASGRLTDVRDGQLIWAATHVASPSANLETQFSGLVQAVLESAQEAGMF